MGYIVAGYLVVGHLLRDTFCVVFEMCSIVMEYILIGHIVMVYTLVGHIVFGNTVWGSISIGSGGLNIFIMNIKADLKKHLQCLLTPVRGMNEVFIGWW